MQKSGIFTKIKTAAVNGVKLAATKVAVAPTPQIPAVAAVVLAVAVVQQARYANPGAVLTKLCQIIYCVIAWRPA